MKKKNQGKLKLDELKVKSFVTGDDFDAETVKGGITSVIVVSAIVRCTGGNCLSNLSTCQEGCDIKSVPRAECQASYMCGTGPGCGSGSGADDGCDNAL